MFTHIYSCLPMFTVFTHVYYVYPSLLVFTYVYWCICIFTTVYLRLFTYVYSS